MEPAGAHNLWRWLTELRVGVSSPRLPDDVNAEIDESFQAVAGPPETHVKVLKTNHRNARKWNKKYSIVSLGGVDRLNKVRHDNPRQISLSESFFLGSGGGSTKTNLAGSRIKRSSISADTQLNVLEPKEDVNSNPPEHMGFPRRAEIDPEEMISEKIGISPLSPPFLKLHSLPNNGGNLGILSTSFSDDGNQTDYDTVHWFLPTMIYLLVNSPSSNHAEADAAHEWILGFLESTCSTSPYLCMRMILLTRTVMEFHPNDTEIRRRLDRVLRIASVAVPNTVQRRTFFFLESLARISRCLAHSSSPQEQQSTMTHMLDTLNDFIRPTVGQFTVQDALLLPISIPSSPLHRVLRVVPQGGNIFNTRSRTPYEVLVEMQVDTSRTLGEISPAQLEDNILASNPVQDNGVPVRENSSPTQEEPSPATPIPDTSTAQQPQKTHPTPLTPTTPLPIIEPLSHYLSSSSSSSTSYHHHHYNDNNSNNNKNENSHISGTSSHETKRNENNNSHQNGSSSHDTKGNQNNNNNSNNHRSGSSSHDTKRSQNDYNNKNNNSNHSPQSGSSSHETKKNRNDYNHNPNPSPLPWSRRQAALRFQSPYSHLPGWSLRSYIVKSGDALLQELFAMQLIGTLAAVWREAALPLRLLPYDILVVGPRCGLLTCVRDATSMDGVKRAYVESGEGDGGAPRLRQHFEKVYGNPRGDRFKKAQQNFTESCAAYSLVGYLLQVRDRHNGNILLCADGTVVHIDFGYCLTTSPGGWNFESGPFKLPQEYIEVMGTDGFLLFQLLLYLGLRHLRPQIERIASLVEMTDPQCLPCVGEDPWVAAQGLRRRALLSLSEDQLMQAVKDLVECSMDNWRTRSYDAFQRLQNGILH